MKYLYSDYAGLGSARRRQVRQFVSRYIHRLSLCISAVVIACLTIIGGRFPVAADNVTGIGYLYGDQLDCSNFRFQASSSESGYGAVRIWVNSPSGTPLVDSFVAGYPAYYVPLGSPNYGSGALTFSTQPIGTKLYARVYRALSPAPSSWDGGNYIDTTVICKNGINPLSTYELTCSTYEFGGSGYPWSGYAAVRIWLTNPSGKPLVDSYVAGYPEFYAPFQADGSFYGMVSFPPQPSGTALWARVYRALSPQPSSWDGGNYVDLSGPCVPHP